MENVENLTTSLKGCNEDVRINVVESLISSMNKEIAALPNDSYPVCIYRVSEKYRKSKEEAYTPRVVSVGPLHHGKNHLQAMEANKLKYLQSFCKFGITIDKLINYASKMEASVRGCYEDTSKFKSEEFSKMILLDGIFVVQLFLKNLIQNRETGDILVENQWMASDLMHDMLLLENQLPLNFIMGLHDFVGSSRFNKPFHILSLDYFKGVGNIKSLNLRDGYERSRHLVEFLVILHRPSKKKEESARTGRSECTTSTSELQAADKKEESARTGRFEYTTSASELQAAGVRFGNEMGELFDVSFDSGLLKLPQLTVNDKTETFFRNLIAFEQCGHYEKHITSYIIFMDSLIDTAEDVKLLVKHKIIINSLGENQLVADLFNNLHKEVIEDGRDFYFAQTCKDLDEYSKDFFHQWKSSCFKWRLILNNKYFNNPWSAISFIAATILVILAIVQTVCSILGLEK